MERQGPELPPYDEIETALMLFLAKRGPIRPSARKALKDKGYLADKLRIWQLSQSGLEYARSIDNLDI